MEINRALYLHTQLAHALLPFWKNRLEVQRVVSSLLEEWHELQVTDSDFRAIVKTRLKEHGVEDDELFAAIDDSRAIPVEDLLKEIFREVLACARRTYTRYSRWTGGDEAEFEDFARWKAPHLDHGPFGAFAVSADTTPGCPPKAASVRLLRAPRRFGPPSWASIPYVLCHELLCHASQAAPSSEATDPLTEGWMDELAASLHARKIAKLFRWDPDEAAEEGQRLCDILRVPNDNLDPDVRAARAARQLGVRAARHVRKILYDLRREAPRGKGRKTLFDRLSVELNAVPATDPHGYLPMHTEFVIRVLEAEEQCDQVRAGALQFASRQAHLEAILRKWVAGQASAKEVLSFT